MAAVSTILFLACTESPTQPSGQTGGIEAAEVSVSSQALQEKAKKLPAHFARVTSAGELVGGTALSASRFGEGIYFVRFEPPIGECAATANSAAFLGFDGSTFRVDVHVSIGFGDGGSFDDQSVVVRTFSSSTGAGEDTSFALILVCP